VGRACDASKHPQNQLIKGVVMFDHGSCPRCNERLEGDGYTSVLYCPNIDELKHDRTYSMEPDANPVYCDYGLELSEFGKLIAD
jgi:hypothetical protein